MTTQKIALADEYDIVLQALEHGLQDDAGFHVAHTSKSGEMLLEQLSAEPCEILLTDFYLGQTDGVDGLQLIQTVRQRWPATRIVLFTALDHTVLLRRALTLGVRAIVSKRDPVDDIFRAMGHVQQARTPYLSTSLRQLSDVSVPLPQMERVLTRREIEVLRFIGEGVRLTTIAARLGLSVSTIATHKANAMRKLGVGNDVVLTRYVQQSQRSGSNPDAVCFLS